MTDGKMMHNTEFINRTVRTGDAGKLVGKVATLCKAVNIKFS